jgi:hypothetical protein
VRTLSIYGEEREYVADALGVPVGQRVVFSGGRTGRHLGGGWVLIWGDGEHYGYLGHCRTCDRGVK